MNMAASDDLDNSFTSRILVKCWQCPLCPNVYNRRYYFDHHLYKKHHLESEEVSSAWRVALSKKELEEKRHQAVIIAKFSKEEESLAAGNLGRKVVSKWGPRAFSSSFLCRFCGEKFTKDDRLLVHIKLNHADQPKEIIAEALSQVSQYKLDGCVYQCKICSRKFDTSNSFMRHARDMHSLTLKQYRSEHGNTEIVSGVFFCKLCNKSIKHTRNIVSAHMKMVHRISWQEYQETTISNVLSDSKNEKAVLTPVNLFECVLCHSKVKLKKQHLDKAHHIDEEVYEALLVKDNDLISNVSGAITCKLCQRLCMDLPRHFKACHKMTIKEYEEVPGPDVEVESVSEPDPASLMCYFQCKEVFKKEVDLMAHIDLKHSHEKHEKLLEAKSAAIEEAALKRQSLSILCGICDSTFSGRSSLWNHITRKHKMKFKDYEAEFGKVVTDSTPFQCKLCSKIIKLERAIINSHLRNIHDVTWAEYLGMGNEEAKPGTAPILSIVKIKCKLCNISVKNMKGHLKNTHCMTFKDYDKIQNVGVKEELVEEMHFPPMAFTLESTRVKMSTPSLLEKAEEKDVSERTTNNWFSYSLNSPHKYPITKQSSIPHDVTNKSLKSCSNCQLNFDTRKKFIEHCQIVHRMKFRLKSGVNLPPPPGLMTKKDQI